MSVPSLYVLHGLITPTLSFYSQIEDGRIAANLITSEQFAAGHPQPLAVHTYGMRPEIPFSTKQLATLLGDCGLFGAGISGNVDFFLKKVSDLSTRVANATTQHLRYRAAKSLIYWTGLSVEQNGDAMAQVRVVPAYDGTNAPLVAAGSVALSGTPTASEIFTLGPVKINGSLISGVEGVSLELNCELYEIASDGESYLSLVAIKRQNPMLTIRGVNAVNQVTYTLAGAALTSWSFALRRMTTDAGPVADGTSSHIVISGAGGAIEPLENSGSGNEAVRNQLRIRTRQPSNLAANAVVITTATTIS